ncbi:MAG TPA: MbcA/ParS/Xre antitoxin family protein [Longimicrobium sp.]|jgi:uncharacterized protein (DUF2384 family)
MEKNRELRRLLQAVFRDEAAARTWLHSSVPMLGGQTPASLVKAGQADEVIAVLAGLASGAHI